MSEVWIDRKSFFQICGIISHCPRLMQIYIVCLFPRKKLFSTNRTQGSSLVSILVGSELLLYRWLFEVMVLPVKQKGPKFLQLLVAFREYNSNFTSSSFLRDKTTGVKKTIFCYFLISFRFPQLLNLFISFSTVFCMWYLTVLGFFSPVVASVFNVLYFDIFDWSVRFGQFFEKCFF